MQEHDNNLLMSILIPVVSVVLAIFGSIISTGKMLFGIEDRTLRQAEMKASLLISESQRKSDEKLNTKIGHIYEKLSNIEKSINGKGG